MSSDNSHKFPCIYGVSYVLAHVPHLVRYGSKPARELARGDEVVSSKFSQSLRAFEAALAYPPHQVFIGAMTPAGLRALPRPWTDHLCREALKMGTFGEMLPEEAFYGWLKAVDETGLVRLSELAQSEALKRLGEHPLATDADLARLTKPLTPDEIAALVAEDKAIPLSSAEEQYAGYVLHAHEADETLRAPVLLENLTCKATGALALRRVLRQTGIAAEEIGYLLGCGEEAIGDRYQRGGGNLAKAIGEVCGCRKATGADIKAFCCAPVHALVTAAALVQAGLYRYVAVVAGGSLAKLGMKFLGHLRLDLPILEDVLAGMAVIVGPPSPDEPQIRLDCVGRAAIEESARPQALSDALVARPLQALGLRLSDVDTFAPELHNPEITEPTGSGNVPQTNYRLLAALAVQRGEIARPEMDRFIEQHGLPGYSPTQGHIASAVPFLGHARTQWRTGDLERALFLAKGSLFLGRMTTLSDGMSFLLN
ncbi:MAG TPA: glycine/sarcosine/betaine reductase complex component C subunit beta [Ktedonobacterales bacterium]